VRAHDGHRGRRDAAEERVLPEEELEEDHRGPAPSRGGAARGGEAHGEMQLHRADEQHRGAGAQHRDEVHAAQRHAEQLEREGPRHERRGEDEPRLHLAVDHRGGRRGGRELDERAVLRVLRDEAPEDEERQHDAEREAEDAAERGEEDRAEGVLRLGPARLQDGRNDERRGEQLPEEQHHDPARNDLRARELAEFLDEVGVHRT
jgi:hypothetical protein